MCPPGWDPPGGRDGDVLRLSVPPGPDRRPRPEEDRSCGRRGPDRGLAGHLPVRQLMDGLGRLLGVALSLQVHSSVSHGAAGVWAGDKVTAGLSLPATAPVDCLL